MAIIILQNITISFENWPKKVEKNSEYPDQKFPMTVKLAKVAKFRKIGSHCEKESLHRTSTSASLLRFVDVNFVKTLI